MGSKSAFTPEEWGDLLRAPLMAGLAVSAASPSGLLGAIQEATALSRLLVEAKKSAGTNPIVEAVVQDLMTAEGREQAKPPAILGKGADEIRKEALDSVRRAAAVIGRKDPDEALGYKEWIGSIARTVAEASKEGGFLGFGGTKVSEAEVSTLRDLDGILGISARV
jgi:hypothetical protein